MQNSPYARHCMAHKAAQSQQKHCLSFGRKIYVQVCDKIPKQSDREINNLLEIKDNYPKYVVTLDNLAIGNENGIKTIYITDFLLQENL